MNRIISFYHADSLHLLKIGLPVHKGNVRKRRLFTGVLQHIAKLNRLAKAEQLYAWTALSQIENKCQLTKATFDRTAAQYHKLFQARYVKENNHQPILKARHTYPSIYMLQYQLLDLLVQYDQLCCQAQILFQTKGFSNYAAFFQKKNQEETLFLTLLTEIIQYRTRRLPTVSLDDFINDEERYHYAATRLGAVEPQFLYRALQSMTAPPLNPKRQNILLSQLRQKWPDLILEKSI